MPGVSVRSQPVPFAAISDEILAGHLLVMVDPPGMDDFRARAEAHLATLGDPPERVHERHSPADLAERVEAVQRAFRRDASLRSAFRRVLEGLGADPARTFWDWVHLRVLPPGDHRERATAPTTWHRDTWSSNVAAQVNWWTPLRALDHDRALAFVPSRWTHPVTNTSAAWDLERLRREGSASEVPLIPEPTETIDLADRLTVLVEPGQLLCFSGDHIHGTVPNTTDETRFSVEVRTVAADDLEAGRGAPMVDAEAPAVQWQWFRRLSDGRRLSEMLPARSRDPAPAPAAQGRRTEPPAG